MSDSTAPPVPTALSELPTVVLSHRGPVTFRRDRSGKRVATRGAGGLVTALSGLGEHLGDLVWICAASTDEDRALSAEFEERPVRVTVAGQPRLVEGEDREAGAAGAVPTMSVQLVDVPPEAHEAFYSVICNPLLWFLQHGMYGLATAPDLTSAEHAAFDDGYVPVNELFADQVARAVQDRGGRALVLLQDYHFYLVAPLVRRACPQAVLSHFVHIPWPGPDAWRILPPQLRERLLTGLLGNDVVGFHTDSFARNFLRCAQELLGLAVDFETMTVRVGERTVYARHYPISIDVAGLEQLAAGAAVAQRADQLTEELLEPDGCRIILRVDRTDPSKNIVRGFRAFATMLGQHPELVGQVTFLALLQPSRQDVPEYADYLAAIGAEVVRINARYARSGHRPVEMRLVEDFPLVVAAYQLCDVLMVNALADGMNLVAKEAVVVGKADAVLALSENTGAHTELGAFAVTLYPFDIQQQADALYAALTMPDGQRRSMHAAAANVVRMNDVGKWLAVQLEDLAALPASATSGS